MVPYANRCVSGFIVYSPPWVNKGHFQLSFVQNAVVHYCITYVRETSFIWDSAGNDSSTVISLYGFSIAQHVYLKSQVRAFL